MQKEEIFTLTLILTFQIQNSECNWGGWGGLGGGFGLGGFHSGYGHNGHGYGSGICAGARRQQGSGGTLYPQQNHYPTYGGYTNPVYYQDPTPVQPTHYPSNPNNIEFRTKLQQPSAEPAKVTCGHPKPRDASVFIQKCIFPLETTQNLCSSRDPTFAEGTTAITSCKSPEYYNEDGDLILEICKGGVWHSDGKTLTCKSQTFITHKTPESPSNDQVVNYVQKPYYVTTSEPYRNYTYDDSSRLVLHQPEKSSSVHEPVQSLSWPYPTTATTTTTTPKTTTTTPPTTTSTTWPYYYTPTLDWRNNQNLDYQNNNQAKYDPKYPGKCPPLSKKSGSIIECLSKSERTRGSAYTISVSECQEPQIPGTEATYKCEMYYEPIGGLTTQYRKCKDDLKWTGNEEGLGCKLECGKSNLGKLPLITFGEVSVLGQWPWHAALFIRDRGGELQNACGATLITNSALLTAAHCVNLFMSSLLRDLDDIRVDLGRYHKDKDDVYVQKYKVKKIIGHPAYNPFVFESDLALIILQEKVKIGFHVRPICFPKSQNAAFDELQLADGTYATVAGWGHDETGESPDELRAAKIKVIGYKECIESFEEADTGALLAKSTTFCAGNQNGTNVCRGDSGGGAYFPVKTSTGSTKWYLQGIVSLGINVSADNKKCDPEKVSIFTRVSPYSDWIVRVLSENDAL